jgi:uncharacterized delta-60 repeat protein
MKIKFYLNIVINRLFLCFPAVIVVLAASSLLMAQPASTDPTFNPSQQNYSAGLDGSILTFSQQTDGKIIAGGSFTTFSNTPLNRIARYNTDLTIDNSFNTGTAFNGTVRSTIIQPDGKILAGGNFTQFNQTAAGRLIRLNPDGSRDASFNVGLNFNNTVNTIAVQSDGKILVGGTFAQVNGVTRNKIARLNADGTLDASFDAGTTFSGFISRGINSLYILEDEKILVGGNNNNGGYLIRLSANGTLDQELSTSTETIGTINVITPLSNGKFIIGGTFTRYRGEEASGLLRINADGTKDETFMMGTGLGVTTGVVSVQTIKALPEGKLLVGGNFTSYNSQVSHHIIQLNADGSKDNAFTSTGLGRAVNAINILPDGRLFTGGDFTVFANEYSFYKIVLNGNGSVNRMFGSTHNLNASSYRSLQLASGKLLVSGIFSHYNGQPANRLIRLNTDGSVDPDFNTGSGFEGSWVWAMTEQADGKILVGGFFNNFNGTPANSMVRLNPDGSLDNTFNIGSGFDYAVESIVILPDGKLLIGGWFIEFNNQLVNGLVKLDANGTRDESFTSPAEPLYISDLVLQTDGKIIVGISIIEANNQYVFRINPDGTRDNTFNIGSGFNNGVNAIEIDQNGKIIAAGSFTTFQGNTVGGIVRLNPDGSLDNTFTTGSGLNGTVYALYLLPNGKMYAGGTFNQFDGMPASHIVSLEPNGSRDQAFSPQFSGAVWGILVQNDGKLLITGAFNQVNNETQNYLVRLMGDPVTTSIKNKFISSQNLAAVYPNPAKGTVNIELTQAPTGATLGLYNLQGQKLAEHILTEPILQLPLAGYAKGLYLLQITSQGKVQNQKLVVE